MNNRPSRPSVRTDTDERPPCGVDGCTRDATRRVTSEIRGREPVFCTPCYRAWQRGAVASGGGVQVDAKMIRPGD